jgi:ATP-binding cassette, subfamily B, bacterial
LISHRFSYIRMADHIYVLKGGKIIEEGSHEELIAHGGTYAQLFEIQAQSYR